MKETIDTKIKTLNTLITREMGILARKRDINLPPSQLELLFYLYLHRDQTIYQKDLSEKLTISRPTVNGIVHRLIKKKMVELQTDKNNKQLKRVVLTSLATKEIEAHHNESMVDINQLQERALTGLTAQERHVFMKGLDTCINNLQKKP